MSRIQWATWSVCHIRYIVEQPSRRATLIGNREQRSDGVVYVFDIYLQGERETVFFDV